jgi:sterile alpha motif and leucine zipper containing kinase AZK
LMMDPIFFLCSDPSKRPSFSQLLSPLKQLQHLVVTESC